MKRQTKQILSILAAAVMAAVTWITVQGIIDLFGFSQLTAGWKVAIGSVILVVLTLLVKDYLHIPIRR